MALYMVTTNTLNKYTYDTITIEPFTGDINNCVIEINMLHKEGWCTVVGYINNECVTGEYIDFYIFDSDKLNKGNYKYGQCMWDRFIEYIGELRNNKIDCLL